MKADYLRSTTKPSLNWQCNLRWKMSMLVYMKHPRKCSWPTTGARVLVKAPGAVTRPKEEPSTDKQWAPSWIPEGKLKVLSVTDVDRDMQIGILKIQWHLHQPPWGPCRMVRVSMWNWKHEGTCWVCWGWEWGRTQQCAWWPGNNGSENREVAALRGPKTPEQHLSQQEVRHLPASTVPVYAWNSSMKDWYCPPKSQVQT